MPITVQVRGNTRHAITVVPNTKAPSKVTVTRAPLQASIEGLIGVDLSAIPNPYPSGLDFNADQRYTFVYDPNTQTWIAALEPVITAIDGGTY
jgi:hypothetical protein